MGHVMANRLFADDIVYSSVLIIKMLMVHDVLYNCTNTFVYRKMGCFLLSTTSRIGLIHIYIVTEHVEHSLLPQLNQYLIRSENDISYREIISTINI